MTIDSWIDVLEEGGFGLFEGMIQQDALEVLLNVNPAYYLWQALFFALSFAGAFLMWKLRKIGFHLYTMAQLLLLIIGKFYIPGLPFPTIPLLLSATFVLLYARNLRVMS